MSASRPRVTYVIDDLGHGGTQRQLHLIARALAGRVDMRVVSLSATADPYAARLREQGVDVAIIPRVGPADLGRLRTLGALIKRGDTDIVQGMLEASNIYAFLAARMRRIPVVLSLRANILTVTGARLRVLSWMYRRADAVAVNSVAGQDTLVNSVGVAPDRVFLTPNIVPALSRPAAQPASDGPVIGCIGRLTRQKRFHAVIDAMPVVRRDYPNARLEIMGEGPLRNELEAAARRAGGYTTFIGTLADPVPSMSRFACLVIASDHEGVPNVALEALALGIPVVAVAVSDLATVVTDGVTGIVTPDGSPASLADAVIRVLSSPQLQQSAAREGPRTVHENFSEAAARERLLRLYDHVLTGAKKRPGAVTGG